MLWTQVIGVWGIKPIILNAEIQIVPALKGLNIQASNENMMKLYPFIRVEEVKCVIVRGEYVTKQSKSQGSHRSRCQHNHVIN